MTDSVERMNGKIYHYTNIFSQLIVLINAVFYHVEGAGGGPSRYNVNSECKIWKKVIDKGERPCK